MRINAPISTFLNNRKISVSTETDLETIHILFRQFPKMPFISVERDGKFSGVIYRYDYLQTYLFQESNYLTASDLTTRNIIYLSPSNSMEEAAEIFDTEAYTEIPIVNNHRRLVGVLRKDDLFRVSAPTSISLQAALRRSQ